MAFRVPAQAPRRRTSYSTPQRPSPLDIPPSPTEQQEEDTAQWVLFSPTARTHTTSTDRTRTHLSDFDSLGTATQSAAGPEIDAEGAEALDDQLDEDGTELDSLDDGLHAFRAPSLSPTPPARVDQGQPALLPAHDGLGSFQASSQLAQDQLWQHEQYNPHRRQSFSRHRRHSSVQRHLDTVDEGEADVERDRWQRIEQWRMDQSRALLQEIQRETRRRRGSRASQFSIPRSVEDLSPARIVEAHSEVIASSQADEEVSDIKDIKEMDESFWRRITRRVIRDLIGIDDELLSVIFGESLPQDDQASSKHSEELDMETVLAREAEPEHADSPLWQSHVLQRITRELGMLVHQLCEHPGAFTSYYQMTKSISSEYAGMSLDRLAESSSAQRNTQSTVQLSTEPTTADSMPSPHFIPTLRDANREHEAHWGIEDDDPAGPGADPVSESTRIHQEQEYWERGLDVMMVFRYLRTRFSRRGYMPSDKYTPTQPPRHTQDASRRAAMIRQHHPLVARAHSRSQNQPRRASQYSGISGPAGVSSPLLRPHMRRPSSSCASQSAKLSALSSRRTLTGSSRNYWDIGGSVDSGSAIGIGVGAGLGAWGEV
ncbi:hypothetical protein N7509_009456 [Penicillium cosmopolitanum]|uniref:Uncharacterized protein n=1 Tax=Penicillium cosmopolitanum TaxID=1131564 RepID=A0A9X0B3P1_9EURO|nr:uncharacterized protein N7509_009456 [Penicillium cosmopolitanum]KAJ5386915.1 hypothetical protein N7509_009456 [Penicillium cosmopolitanum]